MVDVRTDRRSRRTGATSGRRQYRHRESEKQWPHAPRCTSQRSIGVTASPVPPVNSADRSSDASVFTHPGRRYGLIRTRARNSPRAYMFCAERWARMSGARFAEAPGETRRRSQEEDDMTRARRFAVGIIALVAIGVVPVFAAEPVFEGVYIAHGIDSDGTHYRRAVNIERAGDKFAVTWVSARIVGEAIVLEPTWVGVGIAIGDTLSVGFVAGDTFGIMVYKAGGGGQPW